MNQMCILLFGGLLFTACNEAASDKSQSMGDSSSTAINEQKMDYPYTRDHADNWVPGSTQNTFNALSALKAWENNNMDESMKYFADSIRVQFDAFDKTISNDSLRAMIIPDSTMKSWRVKMQDWESSKDKMDEYVSLWYREFTENKKGKSDSIDVFNDLKMKEGKIIGLEQYTRKLHL